MLIVLLLSECNAGLSEIKPGFSWDDPLGRILLSETPEHLKQDPPSHGNHATDRSEHRYPNRCPS